MRERSLRPDTVHSYFAGVKERIVVHTLTFVDCQGLLQRSQRIHDGQEDRLIESGALIGCTP